MASVIDILRRLPPAYQEQVVRAALAGSDDATDIPHRLYGLLHAINTSDGHLRYPGQSSHIVAAIEAAAEPPSRATPGDVRAALEPLGITVPAATEREPEPGAGLPPPLMGTAVERPDSAASRMSTEIILGANAPWASGGRPSTFAFAPLSNPQVASAVVTAPEHAAGQAEATRPAIDPRHFPYRRSYFRDTMRESRRLHSSPVVHVRVDRRTFALPPVLEGPGAAEAWRHRLFIEFVREDGIDMGGLTKDCLSNWLERSFAPAAGLFVGSEADEGKLWFAPGVAGALTAQQEQALRLSGRLVGKMLQLEQPSVTLSPIILDYLAERVDVSLATLSQVDGFWAR
ncbi:MAG TPA: hypothetical protein VFH51_01880, partial [Myxococcota bacterium]|nr:hypothetical protein [Myxococcota bacterium]